MGYVHRIEGVYSPDRYGEQCGERQFHPTRAGVALFSMPRFQFSLCVTLHDQRVT
jgi:hypothetical protein